MAGNSGQPLELLTKSEFLQLRCLRLLKHIVLFTPENVRIEYELAGIASRCGAAVLDLLIQAGAIALTVGLFVALQGVLHFSVLGWPTSVLIVIGFLLFWGYYVCFETIWAGQTPGKRALGLRVIALNGSPIDLPNAAIRGLIRAIDINVIGIISILVTSKSQRLGDLAAGTIVIKQRSEWHGDLAESRYDAQDKPSPAGTIGNIELVTPQQFEAAKRFVTRAAELDPEIREQIAAKIAKPLMQRTGIEDNNEIGYADFLRMIYDRCVQDRGMR